MTGVNLATAYYELIPSMAGNQAVITQQMTGVGTKASGGFTKSFATGIKAGVAAAGTAAAIGLVKDSVAEAREAQKVGNATNQLLANQGSLATVTAGHINTLATAISNKTGIDDEAIQSGQNMLLSFQSIQNSAGKGNAIFDRASAAIADLGVKMKTGPDAAAKVLGKALNDPVKGMTALTRAGVPLTKQQQDQVKAFAKSGDTLKAQKVILDAVEGKVGGLAAASATSGEKTKVAFDNLKEAIGTAMLPVIDKLQAGLTTLFNFLATHKTVVLAIGLVFAGIAAAFLIAFVAANAVAIGIGIAIAAIVAAVIYAWTHFQTFRTVVMAVFNAVKTAVILNFKIMSTAIKVGVAVIVAIFKFFKSIPGTVSKAWAAVKAKTSAAWKAITGGLSSAWNTIKSAVVGGVTFLKTRTVAGFNIVLTFFKSIPRKIKAAFGNAKTMLLTIGKNIAEGLLKGVQDAWHKVSSWIHDAIQAIPLKIRQVLGISSPSRVMMRLGEYTGQGFQIGLERSMPSAILAGITSGGSAQSFVPAVASAIGNRPVLVHVVNMDEADARSARVANGVLADASQFAGVVGRMA